MRALVILALLGGCAGRSRPAVIPMLSELPADPQKRDAVLDNAVAQPGPEQRKPLPPKLHKIETAAATAAAILGGLFSKTKSVTLGAASLVDENRLFAPPPKRAARTGSGSGTGSGTDNGSENGNSDSDGDKQPSAAPEPDVPAGNLVPWVQIKKPTPE
ncbi:MAG TPA: hypothetical protein VNO30_10370 [Kofleriaceae bacterium]|nr:hypothetical protein [Kofleriaceae bacterium]